VHMNDSDVPFSAVEIIPSRVRCESEADVEKFNLSVSFL
jgi:hypothetical protein